STASPACTAPTSSSGCACSASPRSAPSAVTSGPRRRITSASRCRASTGTSSTSCGSSSSRPSTSSRSSTAPRERPVEANEGASAARSNDALMEGQKLDVGGTLRQVFQTYGDQAGVLLPVAFCLYLLVAVVNALLAGSLILFPLTFAVSVVAATLYQGMVV